MKKRLLTPEEKQLWELVAQQAVPLDVPLRNISEPVSKKHILPERSHWVAATPTMYDGDPLSCGGYAGIDRNTADRFRKGEAAIDAVIDLHGMTREKAHIALGGFIRAHYERGSRCVLAITGKGQKDMQPDAAPAIVRGVLREMLPQWLAEPGIRSMVLAFDVAKQKHGGSGAYYILLRRKR